MFSLALDERRESPGASSRSRDPERAPSPKPKTTIQGGAGPDLGVLARGDARAHGRLDDARQVVVVQLRGPGACARAARPISTG